MNMDFIDAERTACLCDVGGAEYVAATVVAPTGESNLILVRYDALGTDATYRSDCPSAPHEQCGPLPAHWQARITRALVRCGRPTKAGAPCRTPVTRAGAACGWHSTPAPTKGRTRNA